MRKWHLIAAACVLLLSGCAYFDKGDTRLGLEGFNPRVVRQPQPLFPNVFITDSGYIVVDQEPIRIGKRDVRDGRVTISWALAAGSPYTFPANGIVLGTGPTKDTPQDLKCSVRGSQAKVFECSYRSPQRRYVYKYTIYARQGDRQLEALDPQIMGDP